MDCRAQYRLDSAGAFTGAAVGIVASAYPAARASLIHPAIAVRSN